MTQYWISQDVLRTLAKDALSALPDAPVVVEKTVRPNMQRFASLRQLATSGLRRLADALEPAPMPAPATGDGGCR